MATKNTHNAGSKHAKPAKKAVNAPVKKAAPKKAVAAKPVKKAAKPVKKAAKPAVAKSKPVAKPTHKKVEKTAKKAVVPAKKAAPVKKAPAPVVKKQEAKKVVPAANHPVKPAFKVAEVRQAAKSPEVKKPVEAKHVEAKPVETKPVAVKLPAPKLPAKPVVMPKINATTSRKYEPDFTKSVLDQPSTIMNGPTLRYSDSELQEFRDLIARKLDAAKKELSYLHGLITRKDEMSGDETDNRYMTMEDGSLSMEREQLSQMASRQHDFIDKLEKALVRIENKTYGICRVTGKLIDKARLRAVPHATLSIEAKMGMSRNPNIQ
jgi:RNA polymerase-binding transcription factor DksA